MYDEATGLIHCDVPWCDNSITKSRWPEGGWWHCENNHPDILDFCSTKHAAYGMMALVAGDIEE